MSDVEDILAGFVEVTKVPEGFADFVAERVAARPSPEPQPDPLQAIVARLDDIDRKLEQILSREGQ